MSSIAPQSPSALSSTDQALAALVSGGQPSTIEQVIALMQKIDALLPSNDGLKWFNRLYLMVTQQVDLNPPGGAWQNPAWLIGLDVIFAGYYFRAIRGLLAGETIPSAWSALFEARFRPGIDRIQFALAGMNAHINHDLALALLDINAQLNVSPECGSPEHVDYESINAVLEKVMPEELNMLAADILGELAQDTGKIGRVLAFWNVCKARDLAWDFSGHLRDLSGIAHKAALDGQDGLTGALGRAILTMV